MPKRKYSRDAKGQFSSTGSTSSSASKKPKATGTPMGARENAVRRALKGTSRSNPTDRNELGRKLTQTDKNGKPAGMGPHFKSSKDLTDTVGRMMDKGTIKYHASSRGIYASKPRKKK